MTFNAQIATGESETTEFKSAFNQETVESVCAKYESVNGGIKVTVFARNEKYKVADKVTDKVTDKVADKKSAEDRILAVLGKKPGCKITDVMQATGFSDSYVRKVLAGLCKSRRAERRGSRKTGGFYLVETGALEGME